MPVRRPVLLAAFMLLAAVARAEAQGMPCGNEIMPLREETEKRGKIIKAASERKATASEMCGLIKKFAEAEAKFAKYLEDNQSWCGIPEQVVKQIKASHVRTLGFRDKACQVALQGGPMRGPAVPAGPGLSEALGTTNVPAASTGPSRGTLDTLTGNALRR